MNKVNTKWMNCDRLKIRKTCQQTPYLKKSIRFPLFDWRWHKEYQRSFFVFLHQIKWHFSLLFCKSLFTYKKIQFGNQKPNTSLVEWIQDMIHGTATKAIFSFLFRFSHWPRPQNAVLFIVYLSNCPNCQSICFQIKVVVDCVSVRWIFARNVRYDALRK